MARDGPFVKRVDPIPVPTAIGITSDAFTATGITVTNTLAFDSGAPTGASLPTNPIFTVVEPSTAFTSQDSATQSADPVSADSSRSISLGTVIGSCVGAFIVVAILIILGIWYYRRYSESLKKQIRSRGPSQRRHSRLETWKKLEEGQDKFQDQTKEIDHEVPMEKLTMFKRGASVRTAYTQKSVDDAPLTYPRSFAPFDTNLVRTLSADNTALPHSQQSQNTNTIKDQSPSNLSPSSNSVGDPLSSSLDMAIPTPEATVLQPHKWESAEVVHYADGQSAEAVASIGKVKDTRTTQNPFFGSQDYTRSRSNSNSTAKSPNIRGQERLSMASSDPFDALDAQLTRPVFSHHHATDSSASTQSKDRALQTLMSALELSEDEVRERLRVASMQPSVISQLSQHSPIDEEDFTKNFLLPTLGGKI